MRIKLGIPLTLGEIAFALGLPLCKNQSKVITHISTDTRDILGEDLFWALNGENTSGEYYTDEARSLGCYITSSKKDADITVSDTQDALLRFASYYKDGLKSLRYTIGITGSVGKSTTKEFLKEILCYSYNVSATEGNFNNIIGLPLTVLSAPSDTEVLILEMGMNHRGEISRLSRCARPDLGIITKVGTSHIGLLGTRENIALAKAELLDGMSGGRVAVPHGEDLLKGINGAVTFSVKDECADVIVKENGDRLVSIKTDTWSRSDVPFAVKGEHFTECLAAAVTAAKEICASSEDIVCGISRISDVNTRQIIIRVGNFQVFDDSYNASFESIIADFKLVASLYCPSSVSILIGTVLELGEHSIDIHRRIGQAAAGYGFRRLFFVGEYADSMAAGAISRGFSKERVFVNKDTDDLDITAEEILKGCLSGETLLLKASHRVNLSRIIGILKKRVGEERYE